MGKVISIQERAAAKAANPADQIKHEQGLALTTAIAAIDPFNSKLLTQIQVEYGLGQQEAHSAYRAGCDKLVKTNRARADLLHSQWKDRKAKAEARPC